MEAIEYGALIRSITSNLNNYIGKACQEHGIQQGQFEYFLIIAWQPGINQLEIARKKNVGKAAVTKALKILESDGFIVRTIDSNDKRNIICHLTKKGEGIMPILKNISANIQGQLFQGFQDKDMTLFYEYLCRLVVNSSQLQPPQ